MVGDRSLFLKRELMTKSHFKAYSVVNYPNNEDYTRITEYKKLTGQVHHKTTVHYEYPQNFDKTKNEPYYPILDDRNRT